MASISTKWRTLLAQDPVAAIGDLGSKPFPGNVFYVDSNSGNTNANVSGKSWTDAWTTVDYAVGQCTASKGDVIFVKAGHAETLTSATTFAMDVAGVQVIGLGSGQLRPTFTFATATTANIPVSAAGCTLSNIVCVCNLDSVVAAITVSAADAMIDKVEFRDQTDKEFVTPLLTTASADRLTVTDCYHNGFVTGDACTEAFSLIGVDTGLIQGCRFLGNYSTSAINLLTTASTKLVIKDCTFLETGSRTMAKLVTDTVGGSTWVMTESFDFGAGRKVIGGSAQAVQPDGGEWRYATAASSSPLTAATLWTYTGTIEAMIVGRVTTVIQSQATTVKLQVTSDSLSAADLCGTKDMNAMAVGTLLSITGTPATGAVASTGVANAVSQVTPSLMTCVTSGTIQPVFGAASTGAIAWEMRWRPVSRGASVV